MLPPLPYEKAMGSDRPDLIASGTGHVFQTARDRFQLDVTSEPVVP